MSCYRLNLLAEIFIKFTGWMMRVRFTVVSEFVSSRVRASVFIRVKWSEREANHEPALGCTSLGIRGVVPPVSGHDQYRVVARQSYFCTDQVANAVTSWLLNNRPSVCPSVFSPRSVARATGDETWYSVSTIHVPVQHPPPTLNSARTEKFWCLTAHSCVNSLFLSGEHWSLVQDSTRVLLLSVTRLFVVSW